MYFDEVARRDSAGAGLIFVSPEKHILPYSFVLTQLRSNNLTEYQALSLGLQMAIEMGITDLNIYGESQLVINQLLYKYEVKKEDLVPYHKQALPLLNKLDKVKLGHVPRSANKMADVLASLAATLTLGAEEGMTIPVCSCWVVLPVDEDSEEDVNMICVLEIDAEDWRQPVIGYLERGKLPSDPRHKREIQRRAPSFLDYNGTLYRCSFLGLWLRGLNM